MIRQRSFHSAPAAIARGRDISSTLCQLAVAKLPSSQKTMFGNVSSLSARYCIRLTSAAKKPLRMIPDRISPSVLSRPCRAARA